MGAARRAYSYLRFSKPEQGLGDSQRRQLAMARDYADRHGLLLDDALTYKDVGVSAYRGRNARLGALRVFLDAVEDGQIPKGSHLLVESLDRLSRDQILSAQGLFLLIIGAGIRLVTLLDERCYSVEGINDNPYDLIVSLVTMMRANEEAATKGRRLREAWGAKRLRAPSMPMTSVCPSWLRLNRRTGRFEVRKRQADVVRRIFQDTVDGLGQHVIARNLNAEKVPVFGTGNKRGLYWHRSFVTVIQKSPAVIGTMVPAITRYDSGKLRIEKQEPIPDYFPAILERDVYDRVQEIRSRTKAAWIAKVGGQRGTRNVLAWLARCPRCDGSMMLVTSGDPNWRYLLCFRANSGAGCRRESVRYPEVERTLIGRAAEIVALKTTTAIAPDPGRLNVRLREFRDACLDDPVNLGRINVALRSLLLGVVVDRANDRLLLRWRDASANPLHDVWRDSGRSIAPRA